MLRRSQRIRSQEDLLLPLYGPLAKNADEGDFRAPFFSVLAALAVASNDTLWEKLTFVTRLFDVNDNKVSCLCRHGIFCQGPRYSMGTKSMTRNFSPCGPLAQYVTLAVDCGWQQASAHINSTRHIPCVLVSLLPVLSAVLYRRKFMDKREMCALLDTLAGVLNSLKLLKIKTSHEELESVVMRAFLEGHLDHRKGMTTYEVTTSWKVVGVPLRWLH